MEIKMTPIAYTDIPGVAVHGARPHDEWAKAAVKQFAGSGMEAAELYPPAFAVSIQTVRSLLAHYGKREGVRVRATHVGAGTDQALAARHPGETHVLFLYRKGE